MATKAELYRAAMERSGPKKPPKPKKRAPQKTATAPSPKSHNEAPRKNHKATYTLDPVTSKRPPRRSTRKSASHLKTDAPLRIATIRSVSSPEARARGRS